MDISSVRQLALDIELVVFDVDGVFTDGSIAINHLGEETKTFNVRDGHGVRMLMHYGVDVAVISGRESKAVTVRMQELGITTIMQGHIDKRKALTELMHEKNVASKQIAFVGDDIIDVPAMQISGLSLAVADAHPWVIRHAHHSTTARGGHGAVREVCELIMDAKGLLEKALNHNVQ